ncbi:MAG: RNA polymerase sigma factor [Bacteroidia bacterium]
MNTQHLITQIRNGEQKGFKKLYNYLPVVKKWLIANGCAKEDVPDIFQQALLVFCEKCQNPDFTLTASIDTYLFSVSKFVFYAKTRKDKKPSSLDELELAASNDLDELLQKEERLYVASQAFAKLGDKCRSILRLFYLKKETMKSIAAKVGLRNEKVAKNQKYKCLKKAKEYAAQLTQSN